MLVIYYAHSGLFHTSWVCIIKTRHFARERPTVSNCMSCPITCADDALLDSFLIFYVPSTVATSFVVIRLIMILIILIYFCNILSIMIVNYVFIIVIGPGASPPPRDKVQCALSWFSTPAVGSSSGQRACLILLLFIIWFCRSRFANPHVCRYSLWDVYKITGRRLESTSRFSRFALQSPRALDQSPHTRTLVHLFSSSTVCVPDNI